jgi:hypothetical protein
VSLFKPPGATLSAKQIRDVLKAQAAMTKIQMTKTFHNPFRTLDNLDLGHCLAHTSLRVEFRI